MTMPDPASQLTLFILRKVRTDIVVAVLEEATLTKAGRGGSGRDEIVGRTRAKRDGQQNERSREHFQETQW